MAAVELNSVISGMRLDYIFEVSCTSIRTKILLSLSLRLSSIVSIIYYGLLAYDRTW